MITKDQWAGLRDALEKAYRDGFLDGEDQCSRYERGNFARNASQCWEISDTLTDLKQIEAEKFTEHLEQATRIVESWPWWKQNCLDNQPTCKQPRKPI